MNRSDLTYKAKHNFKKKDLPASLLIYSPYYPPHVGGLQSHAEQFNTRMARAGVRITVFTARRPESAPGEEKKGDVRILRWPAWEIIPNYPLPQCWRPSFRKQWRKLNEASYDMVISRTRFFPTSLMALIHSRTKGTPWLHVEHGSDFVSLAHPLLKLAARLYDHTGGRLVLRSADAVVANSRASAAFVKRLSGRRADVIYRGVDTKTILDAPADDNLRNKYRGRVLITFIGRLIDGKGVDDLLFALKKLLAREDLEKWHCLIIGGGPQKDRLVRLTRRLGLERRVTFLGQMSPRKSMGVLKTSQVFVNPSHTEGLPTSVIEAALCGTAVVATDAGGTSEILTHGKSALLVQPRDRSALARAVAKLAGNPAMRKKLAASAFQETSGRFSWEASIKAYRKIMKKFVPAGAE